MFRETQNCTNEELNVLKKRYNGNEAWWKRASVFHFIYKAWNCVADFVILWQIFCTDCEPRFVNPGLKL